ncbi:MAG: hypothetical protein JW910_15825 [Anaerolineae bacterium]|nr:hypothetical protein [Anaerolineae bacterium]
MSHSVAEARVFHLSDLPLVMRLKSRGISLDSESYLARGLHTMEDAALSRLPLGDFGTPTVVARYGAAQVFGQFRHQVGDSHAHIVFIAPALVNGYTDAQESAWLHLLDALAVAAAEHGAQTIHADVDENSVVFAVLRHAGYAPYASQDIWMRGPIPPTSGPEPAADAALHLRPARDADVPALAALHTHTVPQLARQADPPPLAQGLVYFHDGKACAYVAVSAGNRGIYLRPYLHADYQQIARPLLEAALALIPQAARVPVFVCVRNYQDWLGSALAEAGFSPWARQTVLVRHTTVRVRKPAFATLPAVPAGIGVPGPGSSHTWLIPTGGTCRPASEKVREVR